LKIEKTGAQIRIARTFTSCEIQRAGTEGIIDLIRKQLKSARMQVKINREEQSHKRQDAQIQI
jgi:hypothetical protein